MAANGAGEDRPPPGEGDGDSDQTSGDDFREFCSLCLECYQGRTPKILPCFHTFCLPCLTALVAAVLAKAREPREDTGDPTTTSTSSTGKSVDPPQHESTENSGQVSETGGRHGDAAGAVFSCPTCRTLVTVPAGGVAALQTNFYIAKEKKGEEGATLSQPSPTPLLCQMCDDGEAKEATHTCLTCQQRMCRTCRRLHDKITDPREHHVRPVTARDDLVTSARPRSRCPVHPDQELCFFCTECDVSICFHCKLTSHQPHRTEDVTQAAARGREELGGLTASARRQIEVIERTVTRLARDSREVTRQRHEVTEELGARYDEILRWVRRSRDETLEAVATRAEQTMAALRGEETVAVTAMEELSRLVSQAARITQSSRSAEILVLKNEMNNALLGEDRLNHFATLGDREDQTPVLQVKVDTSALDLSAVQAYLGVLTTPGDASTSQADLSLKEQVLQANRNTAALEAEMKASLAILQDKSRTVEKLAQDAKANTTAVETKLKSTEQDLQQAQTQVASLRTELRSAQDQLKKTSTDLGARISSTEGQLQTTVTGAKGLETQLATAQSQLDRLQKRVAFTIWHSTNPLKVAGSGTLVMDHVHTNVGNGYNPADGIFTVPESGLYDFQATIMTYPSNGVKKVYAEMVLGGQRVGIMVADSTHGFWDQSSIRAVTHAKKGDQLFLRNVLTSAMEFYAAHNQPYTSFSGFLVQAD